MSRYDHQDFVLQGAKDFVESVMSKISFSASAEDAVKDTDLVIEAIVENLDVKKKLFSAIDKVAPKLVS